MRPQYTSRLRRRPTKHPNRIREYRLRLGLTQRELAQALGIDAGTLSAWECGVTCPSTRPLLQLAKALATLAEALYPDFYQRVGEEQPLIASKA